MSSKKNFVAAVLDWHVPSPADWRSFVIAQLAARDITMDGDELFHESDFAGWGELLEPESAREIYGAEPWFSLADRGDFRGRPVGFFAWEHLLEEHRFVDVAVSACRGTVGRLDNQEAREPICERRYSLDNLLKTHGFEDGDAFLSTTDAAYTEAMSRRMSEALEEEGLTGWLGFHNDTTIHNPVSLVHLERGGEQIEPTIELLRPIEVSLLVLDLGLFDDDELWRWP